jgi:hypothetical protein
MGGYVSHRTTLDVEVKKHQLLENYASNNYFSAVDNL